MLLIKKGGSLCCELQTFASYCPFCCTKICCVLSSELTLNLKQHTLYEKGQSETFVDMGELCALSTPCFRQNPRNTRAITNLWQKPSVVFKHLRRCNITSAPSWSRYSGTRHADMSGATPSLMTRGLVLCVSRVSKMAVCLKKKTMRKLASARQTPFPLLQRQRAMTTPQWEEHIIWFAGTRVRDTKASRIPSCWEGVWEDDEGWFCGSNITLNAESTLRCAKKLVTATVFVPRVKSPI